MRQGHKRRDPPSLPPSLLPWLALGGKEQEEGEGGREGGGEDGRGEVVELNVYLPQDDSRVGLEGFAEEFEGEGQVQAGLAEGAARREGGREGGRGE